MTREKKNLFTGALIVIIVYVATLWQRPMFAPQEFNFAALSMYSDKNFCAMFNGLFGKALSFNIVSVRLIPALSAIICALCVRHIGKKEHSEKFGNIAAVIFLSTALVFSFGTACLREMINTLFFTLAMTFAFSAFEAKKDTPAVFKYLSAAAGGCSAGLFAVGMGLDALFFPFLAISFYAISSRPKDSKVLVLTGFLSAAATIMLWVVFYRMSLFSKYSVFRLSQLYYLLAGTLPWGLFIPQAVMGAVKNRKEFFQKRSVRFSLSAAAAGILVLPVSGILPTSVMISPFAALLFTAALRESQNDEKALKISHITLKIFSALLLAYTAAVTVLCCIRSVPHHWKMYSSKAELAGFAVACIVALIQFKTAADEQPHNKTKKILHIAAGTAVLMILLPGVIPQSTTKRYAPEKFIISTAARYIPPKTAVYADYECFGAARWALRRKNVTLINTRNREIILKRIKERGNAVVISTSRKLTGSLPKNKTLFVSNRWRIAICQ